MYVCNSSKIKPQEEVKMSTGLASYAIKRIEELEATNASLKKDLSSNNTHIDMLEEKILTISVALASSRAREDEHNLMIRRQFSQASMMFEDGNNSAPTPADLMDDSIRSTLSSSSLSSSQRQSQQRFSLPSWVSSSSSSTTHDDIDDSMRSLGSVGGLIGFIIENMAKELDFPTEELSRVSDITLDDEEEGKQSSPLRRRPNGSLSNRHHISCSSSSPRLIGSTVLFPREDDDFDLGFE